MGSSPTQAPGGGADTCPDGYYLDTTLGLCLPLQNQISVTSYGTALDPTTGNPVSNTWILPNVSASQVNEQVAGQQQAIGFADAGIIERFVSALFHAILILLGPFLTLWFSLHDSFCAVIANFMTAAQGEGTPGFYQLSAALVSDLFGVEIDPTQLMTQYTSFGRLASITALGTNMVNLLASEFVGTYQSSGATGYSVVPGTGIGNLPVAQLTPAGGVQAAAAFLGFGAEFAVREANAEMVTGLIPYGLGEGVRSAAVQVAKSLNLGRMGRIALMPLFKLLVATPLQWALNQQYTPTLLNPEQAFQQFFIGQFQATDLANELAWHGYSSQRQAALEYLYTKHLNPKEVLDLIAFQQLSYTDWSNRVGQMRYQTAEAAALLNTMEQAPAREVCLAIAKKYVTDYVEGTAQLGDVTALLSSLPYITPGEVNWLNGVISAAAALNAKGPKVHQKKLTAEKLKKAYYDGIIDLGTLEAAINSEYPSPSDQQVVLFEDLFGQTAAETAEAALKARAAKYGIPLSSPPTI